MNKKKIIICMICTIVLIGVYVAAVCYQSYTYPAPLLERVHSGEVITFDEYDYKVVESSFLSEEDVERFWKNDIESFGEVRVLYVKLQFQRIAEKTENSKIIQMSDFTLVSDTYNQAPDLERFSYFNSPEELMKTHNNIGDSKEICLVFTIPKVQFTDKQWENMKVADYRIHISRYPVIKEVQL